MDILTTVRDKLFTPNPATNPHELPPKKNTAEFRKRFAECERIYNRYPDRVPCIIITHSNMYIDKPKFLVPGSLTWGQLMYAVRKRLMMSHRAGTTQKKITAVDMLYGVAGSCLIPVSKLVALIAQEHAAEDGMLYVHIYLENTFG